MREVVKSGKDGCEIVRTNDRVNPYGLRVDGTVVMTSWSLPLVEMLLDDEPFRTAALRELDAA